MDRLVVTATLREGAELEARRLVVEGPPFDPEAQGFDRHAVYVSARDVVFVFEGPGADRLARDLVDDPLVAVAFGAWAPLTTGTPRVAREAYSWERPHAFSSSSPSASA
jgi:hypothetical protein